MVHSWNEKDWKYIIILRIRRKLLLSQPKTFVLSLNSGLVEPGGTARSFHSKLHPFFLCPQISGTSEGTKSLLNNDVMSFMTFQCALFDFPCCGYFYTFYRKGPVKGRRPSVSKVIIHKLCSKVSLTEKCFFLYI